MDFRWVDTWAEKWGTWPDGNKDTDTFRTIARAFLAQKAEIASLKAELNRVKVPENMAETAARLLGSLGGRTKGKTKARAVDYSALARLSHQKRRENKAKH